MSNRWKKFGLLAGLLALGGAGAQAAERADAFVPANPPEMKPIVSRDTPAWRTAKNFQRGVNLGDYLEAPRKYFGQGVTVSAEEIAQIKREGFDHVRVPAGWHQYAGPGPEFRLEPLIFSRVDFVVTNALNCGLAVMINIHHFNELDANPTNAQAKFIRLWRQIAEHYRDYPPSLVFELVNEPHDKATTTRMNPIYAEAIAAIRETNPHRTLVVEPGGWGSIGELKNLVLPPDENVMVSVHCYEPFHFTHQGAGWTGPDFRHTGIVFPGPPATPLVPDPKLEPKPWVLDWLKKYNTLPAAENPSSPAAFAGKLAYARAWAEHYGRPVHLGEFGAIIKADDASRANFYSAFRRECERLKLGWCIWDWSGNFRYWDKSKKQPAPGLPAALFAR